MTEFKIKPKGNLLVRDPVTGTPLSSKGEVKPRNSHWLRRLQAGDVLEVKTKTAAKKAAAK